MTTADDAGLPSVLLQLHDGRWVCEAASPSWRGLRDSPDGGFQGEPVGALLFDRFVAEALGRLCDLAALTSTRRRLVTSSISGATRVAEAVPTPPDVPGAPLRVVLSLAPSSAAPASVVEMGQVLDTALELVAVFDRSLRVVKVNDAVCEVSGIPPEDLVGKTNVELGYPPALADIWDSHHREVFETGQPRVVSYELPTVLGPRQYESTVWPEVDASGQVSTVVVVSHDVTRQHLDDTAARRRRSDDPSVSAMWKQLEPTPWAAAAARRDLTDWLLGTGLASFTDAVVLTASELVTNAAMHAGTVLYLHAQLVEGRVRLEVHDGSSRLPTDRDADGVGGRGLALVSALSTRWGGGSNAERRQVGLVRVRGRQHAGRRRPAGRGAARALVGRGHVTERDDAAEVCVTDRCRRSPGWSPQDHGDHRHERLNARRAWTGSRSADATR